ncbi:MAG: hypothetical protein WBN23_11940 [Woeseia sp.]|jgi:FtsP/CotA-like multicopper oxidase with cupredoxin domain
MMRWLLPWLLLLAANSGTAQHAHHDGMQMDSSGMVMNENRDQLPRGCDAISRDQEFTIHAGRRYANDEPGVIFGMDTPEVVVSPCSRVTVHFVNEDDVRHQWMVHGLPRYLYPGGMFHIEAMGGQRQSGTFIVPAEDRNYLIHCDMAQHMEKGMRAQLKVGEGSGNLWAVPGLSDAFQRADYVPRWSYAGLGIMALLAFLLTFVLRR